MSTLKIASLAALLTALSLVSANACDYSVHSNVTADATRPAESASDQQASMAETSQATDTAVATSTPLASAQTADAAPAVVDGPKAN